jgi:acyl-CoA thioesterase-1
MLCVAAMVTATVPTSAQTVALSQGSTPRTVLVVGDSLSAEYGLPRGSGWVAMLARRVCEQYPKYKVVNASLSGDTTSGGLARMPQLLRQHRPTVVVLELGANDALRGLPLDMTESNLDKMADAARRMGARLLIVGMQIPPNYGPAYTESFKQIFAKVAKKKGAALVPFLMEGIADDRDLFQADGIHPNEQAQERLLANVWPQLRLLLEHQ